MAPQLPPDLERLGTTLTAATARAVAVRRHRIEVRRRIAACLAVGLVVFAASPTHLGPAQTPGGGLLMLQDAYGNVPDPCDPPHGDAVACLVESPPPQVR